MDLREFQTLLTIQQPIPGGLRARSIRAIGIYIIERMQKNDTY